MPFVTTAGNSIKLKDIVPMEGSEKGGDGGFQLSWYDLTKKGFRFVTWYEEIYEKDGETLVTDEGGWGEYEETQSYPDDIDTLEFGPGVWFFVTPASTAVDPKVTAAGQLLTSSGAEPTTYLACTPSVKTCVGNPLPVTTLLKDVVPMEGNNKGGDGGFQLSWYDMTKKGFRFVTWYQEIYEKDGETLVTDQGGWGEYEDTQSYPDDIATIGWDVGAGFFITPASTAVDPAVHFINPFYTAK